MSCIDIIRDSVETSIKLKLFKSKKKVIAKHMYSSKLVQFPISKCKTELYNFNPERLQKSASKAYPSPRENQPTERK